MFFTYFSFIALSLVSLINASALPKQTPFEDSTRTSTSGPTATSDCPSYCGTWLGEPRRCCTRQVVDISSIMWSPLSITATITAETVLLMVDPRANVTSRKTITNTEIDLQKYAPVTDLNSAGTRTTAVVVTIDNAVTTQFVTYPSEYHQDYPTDYSLCGTLSTTISGLPTCIRHPCTGKPSETFDPWMAELNTWDKAIPSFTFMSHPPPSYPSNTVVDFEIDPKGLTHEAVWMSPGDWVEYVKPLFPDLEYWNCVYGLSNRPATSKEAALYMTATSTVIESHTPPDIASDVLAPAVSASQIASLSAKAAFRPPDVTTGDLPVSSPFVSLSAKAATKPLDAPSITSKNALDAAITPGSLGLQQIFSELPVGDERSTSEAQLTVTLEYFSSEQLRSHPSAMVPSPTTSLSESLTSLATSRTPSDLQVSQFAPLLPFWGVPTESEEAPIVSNHHTMPQDSKAPQAIPGQTPIAGSSTHHDADDGVMVQTSNGLALGSSSPTLLVGTIPAAAADTAVIVGGHTFAANTEGGYIVGTQTLSPGSSITIGSGTAATQVQLQTSDNAMVFIAGSATSTFDRTYSASQALTIGSQVVVANSNGQYVVGSSTLSPGDVITLTGSQISLAPSTTQGLVGTTGGLGGQIMDGFGSEPSANATSVQSFTGSGARPLQAMRMPFVLLVVILILALW